MRVLEGLGTVPTWWWSMLPAQARAGVVARAAAEEVKTVSTNGAPLKPSTAALDFDELTELIK